MKTHSNEDAYYIVLKERKFSDLYLCFCGYSKCESLFSFGPYVRPNYIIHYITKGKGKYTVGNKTYNLEAGQGFLIEPDELTFYQADEFEPWEYVWVGFDGSRAEEYLKEIGLSDGTLTYETPYGDELYEVVNQMLDYNTSQLSHQYQLQGLLYQFWGILSRNPQDSSLQQDEKENHYVTEALDYIQRNYSFPIRVQDVANYVSINRSYLSTLFKRELQYSPQEYLTNYRLTRAEQLLSDTTLSVESVALSCGYQDPLVFSKAFKRKTGMTPIHFRKYRKEIVKSNREKVTTRNKEL